LDIEVKRVAIKTIKRALEKGDNVIRDGHYIVNHIGTTTYVAFWRLKTKELLALAEWAREKERR